MTLPPHPTSFVGRAPEVESLLATLEDGGPRLLTLVGPPGVGKTRLAVEVARRLEGAYEHGIHFVGLAPLQDADLVPIAVIQALGLQGRRQQLESGSAIINQLVQHLRNKRMLLVLDNFEHVMPAGVVVSSLLAACPNVKFLITSREALRVNWEHEFHVTPFAVPSLREGIALQRLREEPAVVLFEDRARAIMPDFTLTPANAASVVEICRRLDGLPLAIELAAGRIRTLSPQDLAAHLSRGHDVLVSRRTDSIDRHRSLYASIAWSYRILNPQEQGVFRRLSVFRGGFTLDAAGAIAVEPATSAADPLETLSALVEKNLIIAMHGANGRARFTLLESVREFGAHELAAGEADSAGAAHAAFFLALAHEAKRAWMGPDEAGWLDRFEEELGNFRAALAWLIDHNPVEALRLAVDLDSFWMERGHFIEAHRWLITCLEKAPDAPASLQAWALTAYGANTEYLRMEEAMPPLLKGLELARSAGEHMAEGLSLWNLAVCATVQGDYPRAEEFASERLALHERLGPPWAVASSLANMAMIARVQGNFDRAAELAARSLAISRPLGSKESIALALGTLGWIALQRDDLAEATTLFEEALATNRELGASPRIARNLRALGVVALRRGDLDLAGSRAIESLQLSERVGSGADILETVITLCSPLAAEFDPVAAARWLGFAQTEKEETGVGVDFSPDRRDLGRLIHSLRSRLGKNTFEQAWRDGSRQSAEQVIREIASRLGDLKGAAGAPAGANLSPREREVAALVAEGLSNSSIAAHLHIGIRTAETHVQSIMNKIGARNRTQIAVWLTRQSSP